MAKGHPTLKPNLHSHISDFIDPARQRNLDVRVSHVYF